MSKEEKRLQHPHIIESRKHWDWEQAYYDLYPREEKMTGPKWRFNDPAELERAVNICKREIPADSWRVIDDNTIAFASMKAEELYAIAKAVAGSQWD